MMNLDNLFAEGDVSKFDDMIDNQVYASSEFNLKDMDFSEKRTASKKELVAKENQKICLKASKRLQNQGKTAAEIKNYIKDRFACEFIPEGLGETLDKEEGIFGVVLVDCSSFDNKSDYDKLAPSIKRKHQYAIKCGCKDRYHFTQASSSKISGDINAFISEQDDFSEMPIAVQVCPKTGLPVLEKVKDYSDDDAIKFLNGLEENGEINNIEKRNIIATAKSPLNCAKKAFKLIQQKKIKATNTKVDNFNTYSLGKNITDVKISKKGEKSLKVSNLVAAPIKAEVGVDLNNNVPVEIPGGKNIPIALSAPCEKNLNISDFREPEMTINKTDIKKDIPVDVKEEINIPVVIERVFEVVPEIERGEIVDTEWFENKDESAPDIEVDDKFQGFSIDGSSQLLI